MPDDKSKADNRDRLRVAGGEDYEIDYLVEKAGITREEARAGQVLRQRPGTLMKHARNLT